MMLKICTLFLTFVVAANSTVFSQLKTPQQSPTAKITQTIGLTDIEISYSRPSVKGRVIFGDLVPFNEIWRTGANSSSKIKFADDIKMDGKEIKAGQYALYTIPGREEWTMILYRGLDNWGANGYDSTLDVARFTVKPMTLKEKCESLTIDFSDFTTNSAKLNIAWENTKISFLIETPTDAQVEKQISEIMSGPNANTYFGAARFYFEKGKELDKAELWVAKAIELKPDAFHMVHPQAKILAKQGKKKEALQAAEKSLKLAKENKDGDFGYISNNEKLITEIKAMK